MFQLMGIFQEIVVPFNLQVNRQLTARSAAAHFSQTSVTTVTEASPQNHIIKNSLKTHKPQTTKKNKTAPKKDTAID